MGKTVVINQLKEILESEIEKEKLLNMGKGKETLYYNDTKLTTYITAATIYVYVDSLDKTFNKVDIEQKLNLIFNRRIKIKETFYGYVIPDNFFYTSKGMSIEKTKKVNGEEINYIENISDKWIFVVSNVHSEESNIYQHEVKTVCPKTKKEISKLCNKEVLCQFRACITFLSTHMNVNIEEGKRQDYTKFFFEFIKENGRFLTSKKTIPTLGWNKDLTQFAPYSKDLHMDYSKDKYNFLENVVKSFEPMGDLDEFKKRMLAHAKNPFADFAISCSFAAPLLKIIGVRSFLLNYYGPSKIQKSLSVRIGLSIYGKYDDLEMSGADTINVIKSKIHLLQNLPCYIDEIVQKGKKYNTAINGYDFGNEKDRHRLTKDSEITKSKKWRTIGIATSETSILKENDMDGEINRSLGLSADCRPVWLQKDDAACHEYASNYYRFLDNNFGLIGKKYIEEIIKIKPALIKWYNQINQKLYEANNDNNLTDHIASITIVCLGNYIYRKLLYGLDNIYYSIGLGIGILNHISSKKELNAELKFLNAVYEFYEINKTCFVNRGETNLKLIKQNQIYGAVDVERNEIIFILGPLKDYLLKNDFDWNYKATLINNSKMQYIAKKINGVAGKRIVVPFKRVDMQQETEEIEEREAIQEEMKVVPFK
ncbi:MAG: DUF927 domain-containing protein [Clostridiales bacterium]